MSCEKNIASKELSLQETSILIFFHMRPASCAR